MSLVKVFENGAWREFYADPTVVAASDPAFAPGEVDYVYTVGETIDLTLPAAIRSGGSVPTYTIAAVPTGLTATGARLQGSLASPVDRQDLALTATYSDGKTATKTFTISAVAVTPTEASSVVRNLRITGTTFSEHDILQSVVVAWNTPATLDTDITYIGCAIFVDGFLRGRVVEVAPSAGTATLVPYDLVPPPTGLSWARQILRGQRITIHCESKEADYSVVGRVGIFQVV